MIEWYIEQLSVMSNEEILNLLKDESSNYTDDFIEAAMKELKKRENEGSDIKEKENEEDSNTYSAAEQIYTQRQKTKFSASLSNNEIIVKTYHCTSLRRPSGEGYLTITNKRVIFQGHGFSGGGKSKLMSEVPLEHVSGISSYYGYGLKVYFVILGIIFSILSIFTLSKVFSAHSYGSSKSLSGLLAFLFIFVTIMFFVFCKKTNYNLSVFSSGATGSPINIGNGEFGSKITGQGAVFAIAAEPTGETEKMMDEVGAIITDLKQMGDLAIEKWKKI